MGKAKYRRKNADRRQRTRDLVGFWYRKRVEDGIARYTRNGQRRPADVPDEKVGKRTPFAAIGSDPAYWSRPDNPTAAGTETRSPHAYGSNRVGASTVHINQGGRRYFDLEEKTEAGQFAYARAMMGHVLLLSPDAREVLEMDAAGWSAEMIAEQLGAGEKTATHLLDEGLGMCMSYVQLVKPSWDLERDDENEAVDDLT